MCPRNVPVRTKFVSHFTGLSILKVYFYRRAVSCFCSRSTSVTFFIAHGKRIISGALLNVGKPGAKEEVSLEVISRGKRVFSDDGLKN